MNGAAGFLLLLFAIVAVASADAHRFNDSATTTRYRFEHNATTRTQHYRVDRNNETTSTVRIRGDDDNSTTTTTPSGGMHDEIPDELQNSFSAAVDTYLGASSVLYGMIGQSSPRAVSGQCHSQLLATYAAIHRRDVWAMKMLDASATAQPGFVWGNNFWLGSRKQCESVQMRKHITLSPRFERNMKPNLVDARPPFDVDFRMVHARHSSPWQVEVEFLLSANILHLGVCVPMSCGNSDIHLLAQSYLDSNLMEAQNLFVNQADVVQVKDLVLSDAFYEKTSLRIVGGFLLFTICMVTLASLYEPSARRLSTKAVSATTMTTTTPGGDTTKYDDIKQISPTIEQPQYTASAFERFVGCFSLRTNIKSVLSTDAPPSALPTINAFKSIGCFLILNFHLAWYSYYSISNRAEVFVLGEQLQWQWLSTSPLIVDIFFSISGLLLAYNFLRNEKKVAEIRANSMWGNVRLFGWQLLHRYLRLTPLYLVVVGGTEIATAYLAEKSPFWIIDRIDLQCQQHWWRNVLYIQNFFEVEEMCLNWTWSLACEMQFFLLSSALLFAYVKYPLAAKRVFVALGIMFTGVVATISWQLKFTPAYDVLHDLGTELYTVPWVRVLPYLIGVGVGWYLHVSAGQALPLQPKTINLGWTLSCTVMAISHMVTYMRNISYLIGVPMIIAVRLLYGSAACWMIVASVKGHGGWFTRFMNRPVFVHLNKLSYGIYLLNPIVVLVIYGLGDHSTAIEPIVQVTTGVGIMVIVYLISFVFSLLFEMPYTKLSAEILRGRKQKVL